jgi:hypothetical protein
LRLRIEKKEIGWFFMDQKGIKQKICYYIAHGNNCTHLSGCSQRDLRIHIWKSSVCDGSGWGERTNKMQLTTTEGSNSQASRGHTSLRSVNSVHTNNIQILVG